MTPAQLILLAIQASIWLTVFTLGLRAAPSDLIYVLRRPLLLSRSLLVMSVFMPALAVAFVKLFALPQETAVALVALGLSPAPPMLPKRQIKAGGEAAYAIGLLAAASLLAMVWIPVATAILDRIFPDTLQVAPATLVGLLGFGVLLPLVLGAILAKVAAVASAVIASVTGPLSILLLVLGIVPLAATKWQVIGGQAHDGALLAFAAFAVFGLIAGYLAGGPDAGHRSVLGLATASRHPGVAIAIAHINYPGLTTGPAVLLYFIVCLLLSVPFVAWRKRMAARASTQPGGGSA